jgi:hypothetical protein
MPSLRTIALVLIVAPALSACSAETADPAPTAGSHVTHADDAVYTRTIVTFNAAGARSVRTVAITGAEKAADLEARRAAGHGVTVLTVRDYSCAGSDMWLYDQAGFGGNEICFYGTPGVFLGFYPDPAGPYGTWAGAVRSYYAGTETGYFQAGNVDDPQFESFGVYQYSLDGDSVIQGAFDLYFDN